MTGEGIHPTCAVGPSDGIEGFEISPQQRRLWLLQRNVRGLYAQITVEIRVASTLDIPQMTRAIEHIAEKYEILRTTFHRVPGRIVPVQIIHEVLIPRWRETDLRGLEPEVLEERIRVFLEQDSHSPFDFETGPLFRTSLLRVGVQKYLLSLCLPSLCADSASLGTLIEEIVSFYAGVETNRPTEPLQYADLADWQNQLLEDRVAGDAGRAYWKQHELGVPDVPFSFYGNSDAHLDNAMSFDTACLTMQVDKAVADQLREMAAEKAVCMSAILAACWQVLLSRFNGVQDVLVYHRVDGRDTDLQNAVGPLARFVPILVRLEATTPVERLWRRTNKAVLEANRWGHYWNWQIEAPADCDTGSMLTPQFGFQFDEWPNSVTIEVLSSVIRSRCCYLEPFKLHLSCLRRADSLDLEFGYDLRLYSRADVQRLADAFTVLLHNTLIQPQSPTAALDIVTPAERQRLLIDFNDTRQEFNSVCAVHHLFEHFAVYTPDAVALVFEEQQITYAQLNARANQLAHYLQTRGVGPNEPVGLCLERSVEIVIGMLAILKAGGAYVPLDPGLPKERLTWMLQDSGAALLVTQNAWADLGNSSVVACLDTHADEIAQYPLSNPDSAVRADHLVYLIYTSGSTGRPKAVEIEHRHLLHYIHGMTARLGLLSRASYASVSTFSADLGHTAVFGALCGGGCLHLLSSERMMDSLAWQEYFATHSIDCLKIVPSHLSALLDNSVCGAMMLPKQVLVLGGEASSWELVKRLHAISPLLRIVNHYGPTETTVGVLTYELDWKRLAEEPVSSRIPLGRPLPNSRVYVLNSHLKLVPMGVVGEVYIGGAGVGRGYLNQSHQTHETFIQDPYSSEPGARMYRTGDLARHLPEGNIEFVGRVDHQVKVRGFRIEPGEIESVLMKHPEVRQALVVPRDDSRGEKRLVGYVVGETGHVSGSELREYLSKTLPVYMVPSAIVNLKGLPLTPNGKVDRAALPAPEDLDEQQGYVSARTPLEEVLVDIWTELLNQARVSVHANFFDIGGHSLLATQVISRVRETFQIDVPLRTLFDAPTIASFSELMVGDVDSRSQVEAMAEMLVSLRELSEEELEERLSGIAAGEDNERR